MSSIPSSRFTRTDLWREGTWLDLWSVVHFLSGVLLGLGFYFLHFGSIVSAILALLLLISYEMWEMIVQIEEASTNRFMDVVVGMVGYLLAFFPLASWLPQTETRFTFGAVLTTNILMSMFGWRASQKAAALKKRMIARYSAQRARLLKQKVRFQERFRR